MGLCIGNQQLVADQLRPPHVHLPTAAFVRMVVALCGTVRLHRL